MKNSFSFLQKLGKSLMLPIAVLPVAGILLRIGQPDLLDLEFIAAAGNAVFTNLGLLFAIGIAVGFAKENNGAAGLAAIVAYFVVTEGAKALIDVPPEVLLGAVDQTKGLMSDAYKSAAIAKLSVPAGLICGVISGSIYNRFHQVKLPDALAFFSGKRLVPIVTGFAALPVAALFGLGWPVLETGMNSLSANVVESGEVGLFAYGVLNRVLVVSGLHHILNNLAWFLVGEFDGVTGDLRRFFAGDPSAGAFMSGFFPVMMFGLPGACLAMYRTAANAHKSKVAGLLISMALTSFLTGITEPIEFAFIFVAPLLFAIHAMLTGISMVIMQVLEIRLGFGFSAGFFDYVLNFDKATNPWMLWPVGGIYFLLYFFIFKFFIVKFDLKTLGRGDVITNALSKFGADDEVEENAQSSEAHEFIEALGGRKNLSSVDSCMTRLRLDVVDNDAINQARLRELGASGVVRPSKNTLQVIVGLRADEIASSIRDSLKQSVSLSTPKRDNLNREIDTAGELAKEFDSIAVLNALGGASNVLRIEPFGTRLRFRLKDDSLADETSILQLDYRGLTRTQNNIVYLIAHRETQAMADELNRQIGGNGE